MSRVLAAPPASGALALGAPRPSLDAAALAAVERASAEAYDRGRRDGARDAEAAAAADVARGVDAISGGLTAVGEDIARLVAARAELDAEMALAIAEAVLAREPGPAAHDLAHRLRDALARLDEVGVTVHVHPDDRDVVADLLSASSHVEVRADGTLTAGEARVEGRFARALLTRAAAVAAVRDALGLDASTATVEAVHDDEPAPPC